nr:hypothetical protein [Verrucomicrobiae bacterium]
MSSTLRKSFWLMAGLVAALVVLAAGHDLYWRRKVAVYRAELKARGEQFEIEELIEHFPPEVYQAASELHRAAGRSPGAFIQPYAMRLIAPGKAMVGHTRTNIWAPGGDTTNTWEEVDAQVEQLRPALALAREKLRAERIVARLDYSQGFNILLPHLAQMKSLAQRFSCTAMDDLHHDDFPSALTNLLAGIRILGTIDGEHLMISELVRIAISSIMFSATWEAM